MRNLREALTHTLLSEAEKGEKPKIQVVNLPMIERDARIKAMKKRFGASNFKKMSEQDFMMSKSEGFFFHYNPDTNKYFEGNASFQFMFFKISTETELSSPPEIDDYWNHYNFKVDHTKSTITVEKQWIDTRLRAPIVTNPDAWQRGLEIAIERHPEIEDYKLKGVAGLKEVDDLLELPSLDNVVGKDKEVDVYIGTNVSKAKSFLEDGIREPFIAEVAYSAAIDNAREASKRDPDGAWAVLKITVNGKNAKKKYYSLEIDQDIEPEDIEVFKTKIPNAFKEESARTYYKRYKDAWKPNIDEIAITSNEDIDAMLETHRTKTRGSFRVRRYLIHDARVVEIPKKGGGWTLAIEDKINTESKIKDVLAYTKVEHILRSWAHEGPMEARGYELVYKDRLEENDFEEFKEWIFENNPPVKLQQGFMKWALDKENFAAKDKPMQVLKNFFPMGDWS